MKLRMSHVGICVSDWKRSLRFYHDVLGFRFVAEEVEEGSALARRLRVPGARVRTGVLEREGVRIELLHFEEPGAVGEGAPRPGNALGLSHLSLRVDDLAAALRELTERGVRCLSETEAPIEGDPERPGRAAFLTDPDGTLIELVERPGD